MNRLAFRATNHCLTGCGIGEVLGMALATWWGWSDALDRACRPRLRPRPYGHGAHESV